ncbi:MAG: hypothetical protein ABSG31_08020, partial [Tepidisphaeraceae bacterium]
MNNRSPLSREAGAAGLGDVANLSAGSWPIRNLGAYFDSLRAGETRAPLWGGGTSKARVSAI